MTSYFDNKTKRLVFVEEAANPDYWDRHWEKFDLKKIYPNKYNLKDKVVRITNKYLPPKAAIIEGGCGLGKQVYKLHHAGYQIIGIDYAKKTIEFVNKNKPELDIRLGDVTGLEFGDGSFDGYWSFGVIEHFYNGYEPIVLEMYRVLKPGGFLFITFPHMNPLRYLKAFFKQYPQWDVQKKGLFYQFALNSKEVIFNFERNGLELIHKKKQNAVKGLKDEIKLLKPLLQKIYDSRSFAGMVLNKVISVLFSQFASHSVLLVFKKKNNVPSFSGKI
ncbi:MAG: class I SAM-dependent methyltransferase [Chloroflexia bacterium]|nr:class I SAM-dependent methyltransferase [Chloroflexia bacterium]